MTSGPAASRRGPTKTSWGRWKWSRKPAPSRVSSPGWSDSGWVCDRCRARARRLSRRAAGVSGWRTICCQGTRGSPGADQCHAQTGYSSDRARTSAAALAAPRPAAVWSGWPSPTHGATTRLPAPASPATRAVTAGTCCSSRPSGRCSRCRTARGASRPTAPATSRARHRDSRSGVMVLESGCEASPSVATTTSTAIPRRDASAINPPAPRVSSSGCAATTTTWSSPSQSSGGRRASRRQPRQVASSVPDSSCRKVTLSCAPSTGSLTLHLQLRWSLPPGADVAAAPRRAAAAGAGRS